MSHVVRIKTKLTDLAAIRAACARLGWTFQEGQTAYAWYGRSVGDTPLPEGFTAAELGQCTHAIKVPGASYEIGIVQRGAEFIPVWDAWHPGGLRNITAENGMGGFLQAYAIEKAKLEARRKGLTATEVAQADGSVKLTIREY